MKRVIVLPAFLLAVLTLSMSGVSDVQAQSAAIKSACARVIDNYVGDKDRVRPDQSALALALDDKGKCYWGAFSKATSIEEARRKALADCEQGNGKAVLVSKCRVYSVNKKAL
jgi:hypothetical protein